MTEAAASGSATSPDQQRHHSCVRRDSFSGSEASFASESHTEVPSLVSASEISTVSSPCSITNTTPGAKAKRLLPSELKEVSGLVAKVTGWVQIDEHCEYQICVEWWSRVGDADKLLAPRVARARRDAGEFREVGASQRRFSAFLRLHDQIGRLLGLRFMVRSGPARWRCRHAPRLTRCPLSSASGAQAAVRLHQRALGA